MIKFQEIETITNRMIFFIIHQAKYCDVSLMLDGTYIPWVSFHVSPISISLASLASMILPARAMVDRSQMEVGLAKRDKPFIRFPPSLKNINA